MTDKQAIADALQRLANLAERLEHVVPHAALALAGLWAATLVVWLANTAYRVHALRATTQQVFRDGPEVR